MVDNYNNHSANERTYLAWIRTAVSLMAFGFIIEKFDLILSHTIKVSETGELFEASIAVEILGLIIFITGILITIFATIRFFRYKRDIESDEAVAYDVKKTTIFLSVVMVVLSIFLLFYMIYEFELDVRLGLS